MRRDTKRTRVRLDRNVAPCSRPTTNVIGPLMNARKCVHAQKPHSCQARSEGEEKERKRDRKNRGHEANGKKGSPTKQKPI